MFVVVNVLILCFLFNRQIMFLLLRQLMGVQNRVQVSLLMARW